MNGGNVKIGIGKLSHHVNRSQSRILIKGGQIVNDDTIITADIYIEGEVIKEIGNNLQTPGGVKIIEATGKLILPGAIDTNTHLQMSFMGQTTSDDFYSGTKAALAGGTTTLIDSVTCTRGQSILKAFEQYRELADSKVCCDYGLHVCVPQFDDVTAKEMEILVKEKGVNSFKTSLAYPNFYMLDDVELYGYFLRCRELGALAGVHAENGKIIEQLANKLFNQGITGPEGHLLSRPVQVEVEATQRSVALAGITQCPLYIAPVMSKAAGKVISDARREGQIVYGESVIAGLAVDADHYHHSSWAHAASYVMSPPLQAKGGLHQLGLLDSGDLLCVSSNHSPFRSEQRGVGKDDFRKIPHGVNGIEHRLSVLWQLGVESGAIDARKFVSLTSTNAAKLFNLYPKKGRIAVGSDADIVVWDPRVERTITAKNQHENVDVNVFEGMKCHGVVCSVVARGHVVMEETGGQLFVSQGAGNFIALNSHSPFLFDRVSARGKSRPSAPTKVTRTGYDGPTVVQTEEKAEVVVPLAAGQSGGAAGDNSSDITVHNRPPTRSGGRNLQDSTFTIGGYTGEPNTQRPAIRACQPPGGASSSLW